MVTLLILEIRGSFTGGGIELLKKGLLNRVTYQRAFWTYKRMLRVFPIFVNKFIKIGMVRENLHKMWLWVPKGTATSLAAKQYPQTLK